MGSITTRSVPGPSGGLTFLRSQWSLRPVAGLAGAERGQRARQMMTRGGHGRYRHNCGRGGTAASTEPRRLMTQSGGKPGRNLAAQQAP